MKIVSYRGRKLISNIVVYFLATMLLVFCVFPLFWIIISSLKGAIELFSIPPSIRIKVLTLENYQSAILEGSLVTFTKNSLIVAVFSSLITTIISMLCAYAISFFTFRGKRALNQLMLSLQIFPGVVTIIPLFILFRNMNLINTLSGLVIGNVAGGVSTAVILMLGYFHDIPYSLEESARIDGANTVQAFFFVILPLAMPGIVAATIYTFISVWQEYFMALSFIADSKKYTLPVGISTFIGARSTNWGGLLATSVVITIPALVLFVMFQRHFIDSLAGSIKG